MFWEVVTKAILRSDAFDRTPRLVKSLVNSGQEESDSRRQILQSAKFTPPACPEFCFRGGGAPSE